MTEQPQRLYLYPTDELKKEIQDAAEGSQLSVSSWLKLAAIEKILRDRRALDEYREKREGK